MKRRVCWSNKKTWWQSLFLGTIIFLGLSPQAFSSQLPYCPLNLPSTPVTMQVDVNEYDSCSTILNNTSYLDTFLSGISDGSLDIGNGVYSGFCADLVGDILDKDSYHAIYTVKLYSSLTPPSHRAGIPWNQINYILNHPNRTNGAWNWLEIQAAIWTLVHGCSMTPSSPYSPLWTCLDPFGNVLRSLPFPYGSSVALPPAQYGCPPYGTAPDVNLDVVAAIVADANSNGPAFIPGNGDVVAVIVDPQSCTGSSSCGTEYSDLQLTLIETRCECSGTIGDYVWHDLNRNGIQDAGEPGINGVQVMLKDGFGQLIATTTTAVDPTTGRNGYYQFSALCAGNYQVEVPPVLADGKTLTIANAPGSTPADDSNPNPTFVTLPFDNGSDQTIDFGYVSPCTGSIGDVVWHDLNRNGIQDADEPGIDQVTVYLKNSSNTVIATTTTAVGPGGIHGYYQFSGLCAGEYYVEVVPPVGFDPTSPCSTSQTVGNDSNCSPARVDLPTDNSTNPTIDFGFVSPCTGSIGDFVWHDLNRNGIQDADEPGIDGVTVYLKNSSNTVIATTTTAVGPGGIHGYYQFSGLCAGEYYVEVVPPAGYSPTSSCSTSQTVGNDSNCSPARVDLPADNSTNPTIDFGFVTPCTGMIGDFVWHDLNRNGLQDADEPGIDGVTVYLKNSSNTVIATTTTAVGPGGIHGYYQFSGLCAGEYYVEVVPPAGYSPTSPCSTSQTVGNDSNCSPARVDLTTDNSTNPTIDFGFITPCTGMIGDFVWHDLNRNGLQDAGEPGIDGVTVYLKNRSNTVIATTTTAVGPGSIHGYYQFSGLCAGEYYVEVVPPAGYSPTSPCSTSQTVGNDSNCSPARVDLPTDNSTNPTIDFGFVSPCTGSIGDFVWHDLNRNGIQDAGEPGIGGVTVMLKDTFNTPMASTITDSNGFYQFTGLCAGTYVVEVTTPQGFVPTACNVGGDDAVDSDSDTATCTPRQTVLLPADNISNQTIDFGFFTECGLGVDKKCLVVPPPSAPFVCSSAKPIDTLVVLWNGSVEPVTVKAWNGSVGTGTPQIFSGIYKGGEVRFTRSGSYPNDIYFEIFDSAGTKIGKSTFHLSCSDADMNGPEDCGKAAGDGKGLSGYLNQWTFDGMAGNGLVLDCTPSFPEGTDACSFVAPPPPSCLTLGVKPKSLVFKYSGGGCLESDNDQATDKAKCTALPTGSVISGPVTVVYAGGDANLSKDKYVVSPTSVSPGGTFTVSWNGADLKADSYIKVCDAFNNCELNKIHTSCSQPLAVGDVFGSLELVGFNGKYAGAEVKYIYDLTNSGSSSLTVTSVLDSILGEILDKNGDGLQPSEWLTLPPNANTTLDQTALVTETTTNTVTVSTDDPTCKATDSVTVTVQPPPQPPVTCSQIKGAAITSIRLVWDGPDGINILSEGGQSFTGINKGDVVVLDTVGLGNDVDVTITGAVNGMSRFHVSCSDPDMDGTDDCGKYEGDGKDNVATRVNLWRLDGMKGGAGEFSCNVPNSGVVHDISVSLADVQPLAAPTVGDHWLWWSLKNFGTGTGTITKVKVGWPTVSVKLKKVKLDGDTFADPPDISPALSPATLTTFDPDVKKRQIAPGQTRLFAVEFEKNSSVDKPADYTITIEFDNGAKVISWDGKNMISMP